MSAPAAASLVGRRIRSRPGGLALLALLVLLAAVVAALVPRLLVRQADAEVRDRLEHAGPVARSVQGTADFVELWSSPPAPTAGQIYAPIRSALLGERLGLPSPVRAGVGAPSWTVQAPIAPVDGAAAGAALRLTADERMGQRIRIVAGRMPATWAGDDAEPGGARPPVDIAVSEDAARRLGLAVGDVVASPASDGEPGRSYRVAGLFAPRDAGDEYWLHDPTLLRTSALRTPDGRDLVSADVYVAPLTVGRIDSFAAGRISVFYPVRTDAWSGADADTVERQLAALTTSGFQVPGDTPVAVSTGSADALQQATQRLRSLATLLALVAAAPAGVLLAVLAMAARSAVAPWRTDQALALARGVSPWRLRLVLAAVGALAAVPAAVVGTVAAALLAPAPVDAAALVAPAVVAALPIAILACAVETPVTTRIAALLRRFGTVALVALAVLSALAVVVLVQRGVAASTVSGLPDPLLVATPLLVSLTAALLVLRAVPPALGAVTAPARRGRGALAFVGAIRAARTPVAGAPGVAALLIGVSTALLSAALLGSVDGAVAAAAAHAVGADARIDGDATSTLRPSAIAAVTGVRTVAAIELRAGQPLLGDRIRDTVVLALSPTRAMRALRPGIPVLRGSADEPVPVAVSRDLAPELRVGDAARVGDVDVRIAALLPTDADLGPTRSWILADAASAPRFGAAFRPDTVLVRADDDGGLASRLRAAAGSGATVATMASDIAERRAEPAVAGVRAGLVAGTIGSAALALLAIVLAVVAAGPVRARTVGVLRTLGMPPAGVRTLVAWELVPVAVTTVLAGCLLGALLPPALSAAIDLRPLLGAAAPGPAVVPPLVLVVVAAAFLVGSGLAGAVAIIVSGRLHPIRAAKMGEG